MRFVRLVKDRPVLAAFLAYFLILLYITWPLMTSLDSLALPDKYPDTSLSDHAQHLQTINESRELLLAGEDPLIVDNDDVAQPFIFAGMFLTGLGLDPVVWYNLYYLLVFLLFAFFTFLLVHELSGDSVVSFFAGFLVVSNAYVPWYSYWGQTNTMSALYVPLIFWMLERIIRRKKLLDAVVLGLALSLQLMSSSYLAVFLSFSLPLYVLVRLWQRSELVSDKRLWILAGVSFLTFLLSSGYYLYRRLSTEAIERSIAENSFIDWRLHHIKELLVQHYHLSIGFIGLFLFLFGCWWLCKNLKARKLYLPYAVLAIFLGLCLIGPVHPLLPYYWLYHFWPFVDNMRVPERLYPIFLMCFALVSSLFVPWLKQSRFRKHWLLLLAVLCLAILLINVQFSVIMKPLHLEPLTIVQANLLN